MSEESCIGNGNQASLTKQKHMSLCDSCRHRNHLLTQYMLLDTTGYVAQRTSRERDNDNTCTRNPKGRGGKRPKMSRLNLQDLLMGYGAGLYTQRLVFMFIVAPSVFHSSSSLQAFAGSEEWKKNRTPCRIATTGPRLRERHGKWRYRGVNERCCCMPTKEQLLTWPAFLTVHSHRRLSLRMHNEN